MNTCAKCKDVKNSTKLPRGWKNHGGIVWCGKCWRNAWVLRAITIPVVRPLGEGVGWPELRVALSKAWSLSTAAVNLAMSATFAGDKHRTPEQAKIGKKPKTYTYPEIRAAFPDLPSQAAASIGNTVEAKYRAMRYEVVWTGSSSLPSARYPQPYPVPNQAWSPEYVTAGKESGDMVPAVSVALPGGRMLLQLRGGKEFGRQLHDFRKLVIGEAVQGELQILRQRADRSRNGVESRDSGGQKAFNRVMLKMVGWFPRQAARERSGTLFVRTDADSLLVALDEKGGKIRVWNCDHVRRWVREYRRNLQRWSDDQKAEQRPVASFQSRRESAVNKFRNRISSLIKEISAQVAGVAERMKFAEVRYDDSTQTYVERFDWSGLKTRLATKLDAIGVVFTDMGKSSGEVVDKSPDMLATTEGEE